MNYELVFDPRAYKEWKKLGATVKTQFKKKLAEVLVQPRIEKARLHQFPDCYKIKLRTSGYRLVYQVRDNVVTVFVVSIGKREKAAAYQDASKRL
ncbi:type II toxin-antitoxin system RelE family toxin [Kosakonia pseudosacchari]|uniref:Type II toxin-antitoxin system mRNA interferase toxin, RelE/StbE family n=1 Tax=Kosakonia pseudosacchari TaxID=1646340 RepID=A0ABX4IKW6_9ENTR|nr:type II toxin-antitoxin system RelE/ParE family toxin [Kosakonia pseudosacchari]PDO83617.1 type II toxin-antitoxin system mRNA interferase toxin, RelE/StbE family [Kosakonia pseudosacchari]QOV64565.1 type II toxin-antitoxin system RelE/ParE family toxin [Kosakonia pseudosacchari]WBU48885.1 type II toxin-antitoxin system RelE/ParE family toxin [Kosakonia pseudosacchari]